MNQNGACPPSQDFKISSSTDRSLARRKLPNSSHHHHGHQTTRKSDKRKSQSAAAKLQQQQSKASYKRAAERPPAAVARRNARERRRVHTVNTAFNRLKAFVPTLKQKAKRVSKLKILKAAIDYVYDLQDILADYDSETPFDQGAAGKSDACGKMLDQSPHCIRHVPKIDVVPPPPPPPQAPQPTPKMPKALAVAHSTYQYGGGSLVEEIPKSHPPPPPAPYHRGIPELPDEHQITRHQNLSYQYSLPIALAGMPHPHQHHHGHGGHGTSRSMVVMPTIPSTALNADGSNFYGSHVEFVPCHYCGHPMPNSGYGQCDRCATIGYNYVGGGSTIVL